MRMTFTNYEKYRAELNLIPTALSFNPDGYVVFSANAFPKDNAIRMNRFEEILKAIEGFGCTLGQVQYCGDTVRFPRHAIVDSYKESAPRIDMSQSKIDADYFSTLTEKAGQKMNAAASTSSAASPQPVIFSSVTPAVQKTNGIQCGVQSSLDNSASAASPKVVRTTK